MHKSGISLWSEEAVKAVIRSRRAVQTTALRYWSGHVQKSDYYVIRGRNDLGNAGQDDKERFLIN